MTPTKYYLQVLIENTHYLKVEYELMTSEIRKYGKYSHICDRSVQP